MPARLDIITYRSDCGERNCFLLSIFQKVLYPLFSCMIQFIVDSCYSLFALMGIGKSVKPLE